MQNTRSPTTWPIWLLDTGRLLARRLAARAGEASFIPADGDGRVHDVGTCVLRVVKSQESGRQSGMDHALAAAFPSAPA